MSGDLEDFLKRAAQRRQTKEAQQASSGQPATPQRREYTDSRRERLPQADRGGEEPEEVMTAEIVSDHEAYFAEQQREIDAARKKASQSEAEAKKALAAAQKGGSRPAASPGELMQSDNLAEELMRMLKQPGGLRQAVLLKEILDRPEHRW